MIVFKPDIFVGDFFRIIVTRPSGFLTEDVLLISRRKRPFFRFSLVHEDVVTYDLCLSVPPRHSKVNVYSKK